MERKPNSRKNSLQISLLILTLGLISIGCGNIEPKGLYKFYSGDQIGDVFSFEPGGDYIKGDTIFYKEKPKGILIRTKRRLDGQQFITVKSIKTNEKATYINK